MSDRKCEQCLWEGSNNELNDVEDIEDRVAPGEVHPAGDCPTCGHLIPCSDDEAFTNSWHVLKRIAVARGWTVTSPQRDLFEGTKQ